MNWHLIILLFALSVDIIEIVRDILNKPEDSPIQSKKKVKTSLRSPNKTKGKNAKKIGFLTAKVCVAIGLAYLTITEYNKKEYEEDVVMRYGEIKTRSESITYPVVNFGTNVSQGNGKGDVAFGNQSSQGITVKKIGNKLDVKINIRDAFGNIVAAIDGSTWKIYDSNGIDYNNDENGYELVTGDHQVIFQIYLKSDTLYANGLLCSENGFCLYGSKQKGLRTGIRGINNQRFPIPVEGSNPLLFKYPREKFLGQRQENYPY